MGILDIILQDLKTLFEVRVFVEGKVDMQKSFYFMKELGYMIPFNFRWSKLGPYSYELANVLDRLTLQGYFEYTGRYELDEKHFRYIKPNVTQKLIEFFSGLQRICNENRFNQVNFIECAASLHFIYKSFSIKDKEVIFDRLAILKSDRMNDFKPLMEQAWKFIKEQGLLE